MSFDYVVLPILVVVVGIAVAWFAVRRVLSLRKKSYSGLRRWAETVLLSLLALVAVAMAGISGVNAVLLAMDRSNPPGEFYQVNGHRMRIDCMGGGEPTVILDAGLGNDGFIWGGVQAELAKTTRVCSYDRAGFGFSEKVAGPRDADHITAELHGLLQAAGINGPIVLMGHSIAGIYIRNYATHYPEHVAGLVFVDGSTPLQDMHPAFSGLRALPSVFESIRTQTLSSLGIERLMGDCADSFPGFSAAAMRWQNADECHESFSSYLAELASFHNSGEESAHTGPYGDLPVLIFSQDTNSEADKAEPEAMRNGWNEMQENLKKLSTRSRRIIARGSSHYIQIDRRDLVLKEVPQFIGLIRDKAPQNAAPAYGSTTTE